MAFSGSRSAAMVDMNVTPLIDVMMVLLVIFMVTVPMIEVGLPVSLPVAGPEQPTPPERIRLQIDDSGQLSWNGQPMPDAALAASLRVEASRDPQPVIELATADHAQYQRFASVLAETRRAGIDSVGFAMD